MPCIPLLVVGTLLSFFACCCICCDEIQRKKIRDELPPRDYFTKKQEEQVKRRWYNERNAPVLRGHDPMPILNPGNFRTVRPFEMD